MSENELMQRWAATKDSQFLSLLLERLYQLGERKLRDSISKDVLHNAILKMHARLEGDCDIREVRSFFLKTLYNGLMDHYKREQQFQYIPLNEEYIGEEKAVYDIDRIDLKQLKQLEQLIRKRQLGNSRIKFLNAVLLESEEDQFSRQNKFFHRKELKKTISLLDLEKAEQFFTYTRRELNEQEDVDQPKEVQSLYEEAKSYKRSALALEANSINDYSDQEVKLLRLFNLTIALHLYQQASTLNPIYFKPRFNVGFCFFKLEKYEAAVKEFSAALFYLKKDKQQSNFDIKMGSTLRNLGTIYLLCLHHYKKALQCFSDALAYTPSDEKIRLGIVFSACKLNDDQVAMEYINSFENTMAIQNSITAWTADDDKVKHLAINIYKESRLVRPYIPIEKII